jgi:hypothetical protein
MKWMNTPLVIVLALMLVVAVAGVVLVARAPRQRSVRHESHLAAPPEVVHAIIDDVDSQPRWRKDVAGVTRVSATTFVERDQRGAETTFVRLPSSPDEVVLTFEGQGFSGRFFARITEVREGSGRATLLVFEETVQMHGAVAAVMASFFFDLDKFVRQWSADVGAEAARRIARPIEPSQTTTRP